MGTASSLERDAAVCRLGAARLEGLIVNYIDPALRLLPQAWVGPGADQLERDLIRYRETVRSVRWELRQTAARIESEAAALRAGGSVITGSGLAADVV